MLSNSVSNYTYRDIAMNELGHLGVLSVYESEFGSALTNGVTLFHSLAVMLVEYVKTGSQSKVLEPTLNLRRKILSRRVSEGVRGVVLRSRFGF